MPEVKNLSVINGKCLLALDSDYSHMILHI